jgi:hypothetical protein
MILTCSAVRGMSFLLLVLAASPATESKSARQLKQATGTPDCTFVVDVTSLEAAVPSDGPGGSAHVCLQEAPEGSSCAALSPALSPARRKVFAFAHAGHLCLVPFLFHVRVTAVLAAVAVRPRGSHMDAPSCKTICESVKGNYTKLI